jgi:hypothetical protein
MPIAVTTAFTSVGSCQDWDDYSICGVTICGKNTTTYQVLTAFDRVSYAKNVLWVALCF